MTADAIALKPFSPHLPYFIDSFLSVGMGLVFIVFAMPITSLFGWPLPAEFLIALGIFLVPWGGMNYLTSQIPRPARAILLGNIAVDSFWLLGSVVVLLMTMQSLTSAGWVLMIGQGLVVLTMVAMKARALVSVDA